VTLIIAGLFHDPALSVFVGDPALHGFCFADSLGSAITAEGGLKVASKHRRKIHLMRPEVRVPNYQLGRLDGLVRRSIIPFGLAHAGSVYLTSTILIEFQNTLDNLRAVRGSTDGERKIVPPWHQDAVNQSSLGDDPHLSGLNPKSDLQFFAHLLKIHASTVIEDAKEVFGPALDSGAEDFAFALLGYCEIEQRIRVYHLDLERRSTGPALPVVRCRELEAGQFVVLGLSAKNQVTVDAEVRRRTALGELSLVDSAREFCAKAIAHDRFKGVGGTLAEGHVDSSAGFRLRE